VIDSILDGTDGHGGTSVCFSLLEIGESEDADGALRLALGGELDLSVSDRLSARLDDLRRAHRHVRLDLSALEFIDCGGVAVILGALADSRNNAWALEVDRRVSPVAARVIALAELDAALWPGETEPSPSDGRDESSLA
jgi:anti-anti-sigma factor